MGVARPYISAETVQQDLKSSPDSLGKLTKCGSSIFVIEKCNTFSCSETLVCLPWKRFSCKSLLCKTLNVIIYAPILILNTFKDLRYIQKSQIVSNIE